MAGPDDPSGADADVRAEIGRAFQQLRPQMVANARADADLDPSSRADEFTDADIEQILNAYEALFLEALEGKSRETRDLIFDTALPPIVDMGQSAGDFIRSNVISAVMMTHRLLPLVSPERRDGAARWLAAFHSGYACELLERVRKLEAERP